MHIQVVAWTLLILRLISVVFLFMVLRQQYYLNRHTTTPYGRVRGILIILVGIAFIGQFVPILIDGSTIIKQYDGKVGPLLGNYALSNAITSAVSSIGWWMLYRSVDKAMKDNGEEKNQLMTEEEANEKKKS